MLLSEIKNWTFICIYSASKYKKYIFKSCTIDKDRNRIFQNIYTLATVYLDFHYDLWEYIHWNIIIYCSQNVNTHIWKLFYTYIFVLTLMFDRFIEKWIILLTNIFLSLKIFIRFFIYLFICSFMGIFVFRTNSLEKHLKYKTHRMYEAFEIQIFIKSV